MTQGVTGSYAINGVELAVQPTSGRWMPREAVGVDGNGHFIYPPYREFEITWGLVNPSDVNQLQTFFESIGNTGTAIVDLPRYAASTYTFRSYTGCVLQEPTFDIYFTEHHTNVTLLISKIKT
jgi:hypothetical protein